MPFLGQQGSASIVFYTYANVFIPQGKVRKRDSKPNLDPIYRNIISRRI